jgi:predicted nuclease of restriction endonuclease-like RecB superfamily
VVGGELVPSYFTEADHCWLAGLLDEYARVLGLRRTAALARLRRPLGVPAPPGKLRLAAHVLGRESRQRVASPVPPRALREFVFEAAARGGQRAAIMAETAHAFELEAAEVSRLLFADLGGERLLCAPDQPIGVSELARAANAALVAALLGRAVKLAIAARGGVKDLVRATQRLGLVQVLRPGATDDAVLLEASGPYALFRHTALYGRALVSLVPWAARCARFVLRAECVMERGGVTGTLVLRSSDPMTWPAPSLPEVGRAARRLAHDLAGVSADWQLDPDPGPVRVGDAWWWPDAELRHRTEPDRRCLLEIVGFWTRRALECKLALAAELPLLLCVDLTRNCGRADVPEDPRVLPFTGRIDPHAVLVALGAVKRMGSSAVRVLWDR